METAPRNCRFLSLVVVERVLTKSVQKSLPGPSGPGSQRPNSPTAGIQQKNKSIPEKHTNEFTKFGAFFCTVSEGVFQGISHFVCRGTCFAFRGGGGAFLFCSWSRGCQVKRLSKFCLLTQENSLNPSPQKWGQRIREQRQRNC